MTEERLRYIAFELESPLVRLRGVEETLWQLVQGSKGEEQAAIYALLARNLERELEDIRGLWRELFALIVKPEKSRRSGPLSRPPPITGARPVVAALAWRASAERSTSWPGRKAAIPRARRVVNRFLRNRRTHLQISQAPNDSDTLNQPENDSTYWQNMFDTVRFEVAKSGLA